MNTVRERGPIARFFIGAWQAMNFTRRLILNLLFFFLLLLVLAAWLASRGNGVVLSDRTTLVLAPEGQLVEQDSRDALSRALAGASRDNRNAQVQVRDLIGAIDAAAKDKRIERVLLDVDRLQPDGFASLDEVARALQRLRKAGKRAAQGITAVLLDQLAFGRQHQGGAVRKHHAVAAAGQPGGQYQQQQEEEQQVEDQPAGEVHGLPGADEKARDRAALADGVHVGEDSCYRCQRNALRATAHGPEVMPPGRAGCAGHCA